jgi:two-component system, OmpR family, response regulator TctD
MKLLIIHPDELFRSRLVERMRLEKHRVIETPIEAEARDIVQWEDFDVILLGAAGAYQDRLLFLKMIKRLWPLTEVILLTAAQAHSVDGAIEAMQLGAFDDLLLPVDIHALLNRTQAAFKRRRARVSALRKEHGKGLEHHAPPNSF